MLQWLITYGPTILICAALLAVVVLAILAIRRDKKKGTCSCGASCGSCPMAGRCHSTATPESPDIPAEGSGDVPADRETGDRGA